MYIIWYCCQFSVLETVPYNVAQSGREYSAASGTAIAAAIPLAASTAASGIAVFMGQLSVPLVVAQTADLHNGGTVHDVIKCTFLQQRWMWLVDGSHHALQLGLRKITQRYGADSASEHPENTEERRAHTFRSLPQVIEQLILE
jgi:hypothetical protein